MKQLLLAAIAATILLFGCQPASPAFTGAEKAVVEAEIEAALDTWINAEDPAVLLSYLAPDIVSVSNTSVTDSVTQEMRDAVMEHYGSSPKSKVDFSYKHIVALTRDIGYAIGSGSGTVYDTAGVAGSSFDVTISTVWIRAEDGWKAVSTHQSIEEHAKDK